jgi:alkanesulfonate monooxygenase SsuD/methylene tetrahydromethanopterin reductase-like flavin-dependent oxidoreductase (luciferase family)
VPRTLEHAAGPQGRPVICQASGSPAGRNFASKHADTIITRTRGVAAAKAYRADISARMSEYGRQPRDCKVLFSTSIVLGETVGEAREKKERLSAGVAANLDARLAALSFLSGLDFSKFDLDQPSVRP